MPNWTRDEEIVVFDLYCKIPFQRSSKTHPDVIRIANIIGRTPSAVNMKIGNFGLFDETLKQKGIVGLTNASKLDREIWDEFNEHWDELSLLSEQIIAEKMGQSLQDAISVDDSKENALNIPIGKEKSVTVKQRVNQTFFEKQCWHPIIIRVALRGYPLPNFLLQVTSNHGELVLKQKRQIRAMDCV